MVANEGVRTLGRMSGVKSNARNLSAEDAAYRKILGLGAGTNDMEIMSAGPVTINHYAQPPAAAAQAQQAAAAAPAAPLWQSLVKQYALPALLGTTAGMGLAAFNAVSAPRVPQVIQQPSPLDLLPPDARPVQ